MKALEVWFERVREVLQNLGWIALLLGRLTVGVLFASTGWGKVTHLEKVTAFFTELQIPLPAFNARLVGFTELVCGVLLAVGLASRLATLPLVITMAVALLTAKRAEIHGVTDLFGLVEWTYIALLFIVLLLGPGKASVDGLIRAKARAHDGRSSGDRPPPLRPARHAVA